MNAARPRPVSDAIVVDEAGIETGIYGAMRLKSAYQPIFGRDGGRLTPVAVEGLVQPLIEGRAQPASKLFECAAPGDRSLVASMCRTLHLRNHRNIGMPGIALFFTYDPGANLEIDRALGDIRFMAKLLDEIELAPSLLTCEVVGNAALDPSVLLELVREMRRVGTRIAVDYSDGAAATVERVEFLRPDIVKIHGGWFRALCRAPATARLLGTAVASFHGLGAKVLIEGIETGGELECALGAKADLLQGHLLGRPALAGSIMGFASLPIAGLVADRKVVPLFG